jgi:uncharacterized membrane protein YkvA (DUF1232 family)
MWDILLVTLILIAVAVLGVVLAALFVWWKILRSDERKLARRIGKLPWRDKLSLGRDIFRDPRVPIWARIVGIALVVYLASPIDLLPDFIPVLGHLDDLFVVIVGAGLLLRSVPPHVIEDLVARYEPRRVGSDTPVSVP